MNICHWKPKRNYVSSDDFFAASHPFFGLALCPEADQLFSPPQSWQPAIDVTEDKDQYFIEADIPGIKKENIELSAEGTILTIKGERKAEEITKDKNFHRVERSFGQFIRRLDLGENIDIKNVQAKYSEGVLNISVKKSSSPGAKIIAIDE